MTPTQILQWENIESKIKSEMKLDDQNVDSKSMWFNINKFQALLTMTNF